MRAHWGSNRPKDVHPGWSPETAVGCTENRSPQKPLSPDQANRYFVPSARIRIQSLPTLRVLRGIHPRSGARLMTLADLKGVTSRRQKNYFARNSFHRAPLLPEICTWYLAVARPSNSPRDKSSEPARPERSFRTFLSRALRKRIFPRVGCWSCRLIRGAYGAFRYSRRWQDTQAHYVCLSSLRSHRRPRQGTGRYMVRRLGQRGEKAKARVVKRTDDQAAIEKPIELLAASLR